MARRPSAGLLAITPGQGDWSGRSFEAAQTGIAVTDSWYSISFGRTYQTPRFLAAQPAHGHTPGGHGVSSMGSGITPPAPPRTFREHQQALVEGASVRDRFRIDARTSGPTVVYELARIWEIVAGERAVPLPQRALPRARQWWLYVVKPG